MNTNQSGNSTGHRHTTASSNSGQGTPPPPCWVCERYQQEGYVHTVSGPSYDGFVYRMVHVCPSRQQGVCELHYDGVDETSDDCDCDSHCPQCHGVCDGCQEPCCPLRRCGVCRRNVCRECSTDDERYCRACQQDQGDDDGG
jgi:hypothetical protein